MWSKSFSIWKEHALATRKARASVNPMEYATLIELAGDIDGWSSRS